MLDSMYPILRSLPSRRGLMAICAYPLICAILDFLPHHGPPEFRYTGSDPARPVWNLGWPLAQFIYDPRYGLQIDPTAFALISAQCVLFLFCAVLVIFILRRHRRREEMRRGFTVNVDPPNARV